MNEIYLSEDGKVLHVGIFKFDVISQDCTDTTLARMTMRHRQASVAAGEWRVSIGWGSGHYSSNYGCGVSRDEAEFSERATEAEVAIFDPQGRYLDYEHMVRLENDTNVHGWRTAEDIVKMISTLIAYDPSNVSIMAQSPVTFEEDAEYLIEEGHLF